MVLTSFVLYCAYCTTMPPYRPVYLIRFGILWSGLCPQPNTCANTRFNPYYYLLQSRQYLLCEYSEQKQGGQIQFCNNSHKKCNTLSSLASLARHTSINLLNRLSATRVCRHHSIEACRASSYSITDRGPSLSILVPRVLRQTMPVWSGRFSAGPHGCSSVSVWRGDPTSIPVSICHNPVASSCYHCSRICDS